MEKNVELQVVKNLAAHILVFIIMIMTFIYSFCMVSKLNDLITNICCNSETCLPTNKSLIKIYSIVNVKACDYCGFC